MAVRRLGIAGDEQADLGVHGGPSKAVYAYPSEHYPFWEEVLGQKLGWGSFGENLTTSGLLEEEVHVGDRLRIGGAEMIVTQPRFPCFKLGIRFGREDVVKIFQESGRPGFYLSVTTEGTISAGDPIDLQHASANAPSIASVYRSDR